jgi:hypothetical protein
MTCSSLMGDMAFLATGGLTSSLVEGVLHTLPSFALRCKNFLLIAIRSLPNKNSNSSRAFAPFHLLKFYYNVILSDYQ